MMENSSDEKLRILETSERSGEVFKIASERAEPNKVLPSSPYLDSSCQGSCSFFRIQLIWALATKLGCWVEARSFAAGPESLSDHLLLLGSLA